MIIEIFDDNFSVELESNNVNNENEEIGTENENAKNKENILNAKRIRAQMAGISFENVKAFYFIY